MAKNSIFDPTKDGVKADNSGYSSNQIDKMIGESAAAVIDDDAAGDDTVYSSAKIYSLLPEKTASGAVATFSDGIPDLPLKDVIVEEGATKVYRTGKNLFNGENATSGYFINSSGITQTSSEWISSDYIPVPADTSLYFIPNTASGGSAKHAFYDENKDFISVITSGEGTFTTPVNCCYMRFSYRSASTDIQLELGSSATTYEEYTGNAYDIADIDNIMTLSGTTTNIWADTGDISVTYKSYVPRPE